MHKDINLMNNDAHVALMKRVERQLSSMLPEDSNFDDRRHLVAYLATMCRHNCTPFDAACDAIDKWLSNDVTYLSRYVTIAREIKEEIKMDKDTRVKLFYDGKVVRNILTNRSLTIDEACELAGIDLNEMEDENTPVWDYGLFRLEY